MTLEHPRPPLPFVRAGFRGGDRKDRGAETNTKRPRRSGSTLLADSRGRFFCRYLQAPEVVGGALGMGGGAEDGALVVFQGLQP